MPGPAERGFLLERQTQHLGGFTKRVGKSQPCRHGSRAIELFQPGLRPPVAGRQNVAPDRALERHPVSGDRQARTEVCNDCDRQRLPGIPDRYWSVSDRVTHASEFGLGMCRVLPWAGPPWIDRRPRLKVNVQGP